jgi:hypothetical protein
MIRYYLNGVECNPANKREINYIFDFSDRRIRELEIDVDALRFVRDDRTSIKQWIDTYGYSVGMPLDIVYSNGTTVKYFLDFSDPSFIENEISYTVKVKKYKGTDNFFDNANGLSWELIDWNDSDFVNVDYVVIPDDQKAYFISLSLATFALAQELGKAIQEIQEGIADLIKATVPVGVPPAPDWGAIIVAGIKLAARIAYALFIVVALVQLITQLLNIIFPIIRQFKACTVRQLFVKGATHLGVTVQSTLLDSLDKLTILPVPLREKDPSLFLELFAPMSLAYTKGHPSSRDTVPTFGRLIEAIEDTFNCKSIVKDGVLRFEQEDWFEQNASQIIPQAFNDQGLILNNKKLNTEELFKRLVAVYAIDPTDINTLDDTKKTVYEVGSEVITSPDPFLELIKGSDIINIPFARGTRKSQLTFVEEAAKVLASAVDLFTGGSLASTIDARKNVLQISSQYFTVSKLLWMNGTKLNSNQNAFIGADVIVNTYHSNRFIQNNQKDVFEQMPIALTESEIFNILQNNYLNLNTGNVCEIKRIAWSEKTHKATSDYTVKREGINEQTIVINAGG